MSMLRQDPLTGRWIIVAAHRGARPNEFSAGSGVAEQLPSCPFCPGHESETTPEIVALGRSVGAKANSPGWRLRGFANMYPALEPEVQAPEVAVSGAGASLLARRPGVGHHEVVVYTPDHLGSPASLSAAGLAELLVVLRDRARVFAEHSDVRYISAFCNHGPDAGATLSHPHMQIIGAPAVPLLAEVKENRCGEYHRQRGSCLLCDLITTEIGAKERLVGLNDGWAGWAPWASRFPWEMMFAPRRHLASFTKATADDLMSLAELLQPALGALFAVHHQPSLNIVVHSVSLGGMAAATAPESYHWHLEVLPRLSRPAGFEVGTGYTINSVEPEVAAARLRQEWGMP